MVLAGSGTAGAGGYAVNESLNGNTPTLKKTSVNGLMSVTGPGKQVGNAINKVAEFAKDTFSALDSQTGDVATQLSSDVLGKEIDKQLEDKRQN